MESGPSCSYQASTNRIFLSHSGEQKGFVERLYRRLTMAYMSGCIFFDKAMPMGVNFAQKIKQAIEQCELAIVVMSEDYFKSYWPMVELAEIVKAQKSQKQKKVHIVPLYYKLTVNDYKEERRRKEWRDKWELIINAHPNHFQQPDNELECWVEALKALSPTLKGGVFISGNSEEDYIEEIVNDVCQLVAPSPPYTCAKGSERLKAELKEKFQCLDPKSPTKVRYFGMYGISGTGKTEMSRLLCNQMSAEFKVYHCELDQMNWQSKLVDCLCTWTGKSIAQGVKDADTLLKNELPRHKLFLVLDNVQTSGTSVPRVFQELFLNPETLMAGSVVLMTSASSEMLKRTFPRITWEKIFPVPTLQKEEAECLLAERAGYNFTELDSEKKMYVTKFVERCYLGFKEADRQYHPGALAFLGTCTSIRGRQEEWVKWNAICQQGEKGLFDHWRERFIKLLDQSLGLDSISSAGVVTSSINKTIYFDIILTLPRYTSSQSRILRTQEDFCEWYAFTFPKVGGINAAIKKMKSQALLVIEDCGSYWGMGNHPCHRFLIHDLYREFATLIAKSENHSDNCCLPSVHNPSYQKGRINVQNNARLTSLAKENLQCDCSSEAKIMRVVSCSKITKLDLKGLKDLRSLEIRHCPNLSDVNVHHLTQLACLLWEGCAAVKFPSLKNLKSLKLLIIQGGASNSPSMGRLPELPGCLPLSKISIAKMKHPPNLKDCADLQVLHLSFLQDLLEFPHLGHLRHLVKLEAACCPKVRSLGDLTNLTSLEHLHLSNFESLEELPGLGELIALTHLNITNCSKVREIPILQNLTNLMHLCLDALPVEQIPGIEHLVKLQQLRCRRSSLKSLPNLRLLTELEHLDVSYTPVSNLHRVGFLRNLKKLEAISCESMDKLPNLPSSTEVDVKNSRYEQLQKKNSSSK